MSSTVSPRVCGVGCRASLALVALTVWLAPCLVQAAPVQDITAADVIERYYTALGGKEKLTAIKTMVTKGKMSIPEAGIEGTFVMTQKAPNLTHMHLEMDGVGEQAAGFNGETGWEMSSMTGDRIMKGRELEQAKLQGEMFPLWNYPEGYESVEVTGKSEFNGTECHELTVQKAELAPIKYYFAADSGLMMGMIGVFETQMGELEIESVVEDYREVDGIKVAFKGTTKLPNGISQVMDNEAVTINPELAEDTFALPKEIVELKKDEPADDGGAAPAGDGDKAPGKDGQ